MAQFIYTMRKVRKAVGDKLILDDVTLSFLPGAKIGHDLSRGVSEFTKVVRPVATTTVDVGPDGMPEDLAARRFDATLGAEEVLAAVG